MNTPTRKLLISAFGVNVGGGLVLLEALLAGARESLRAVLLDSRLAGRKLPLDSDVSIEYVRPTIPDRVRSLRRFATTAAADEVLLCFNGLPPLQKTRARVVNFIQAPHFVGTHKHISYAWRPALRMALERIWLRAGLGNCDAVWVQTPSMADAFRAQHPSAAVSIMPLVDEQLLTLLAGRAQPAIETPPNISQASFFYPADAVGHKNHVTLLQAWAILAEQGNAPRLYLTLRPEEFTEALSRSRLTQDRLGAITLVGRLTREQVLQRLRDSSALIFPSRAETFGLPLLEAESMGVAVLAAERDFVRDVCTPRETFDPESPRSIARAVLRFLNAPDHGGIMRPVASAEFVRKLLASA